MADALAGYRSAPAADHVTDITRLKAQLRQKATKKRGLVFYALRMAAVGLVLVGAWLVMQQFQSNGEMDTMAEATEMARATDPTGSSIPQAAADSVASSDANLASDAVPTPNIVESDLKKALEPPPPPKSSGAPLQPKKQAEDKVASYTTLDELPPSPASLPPVEAEAPKAESAQATEALAIEEEAAKSANKKDSDAERQSFPAGKKKSKMPDRPSPVGGLDKFAAYVAANLRHPAAGKQPRPKLTVEVGFTVLNDGTPSNFDFKDETPQAYRDEATRLLQEGPKWTGSPGAKASYVFAFE